MNAYNHTQSRVTGRNLGLDLLGYTVLWVGMPGLHWDSLVSLILGMVNCYGIPTMVILHCGGNDIGLVPGGQLLFHSKFTIYVISKMLPGSMIIYSNILPRNTWRFSTNNLAMEHARKRLNRGIRSYVLKHHGYVISHPDLDDGHTALFKDDGVHLKFLGNDIIINTLQEALLQFLKFPHMHVYPRTF